METVVEVVKNCETIVEDNNDAKTSSTSNSLKLIADPLVYQLVRVDGDGRLVPATDDEVMVVEDGKAETSFLEDIGGERVLQSRNVEVDVKSSSALLNSGINLMNSNFQEFKPSGMGISINAVRKANSWCGSQPVIERGNKVVKARVSPAWVQQLLVTKSDKAGDCVQGKKIMESNNDEIVRQQSDSDGDNSYDYIATLPTANGGMRRKHHCPWALSEVVKLVEGVAGYGAGRWSEIRRASFASYSYRTSVDLKDKWRNLLRASFAQLPADKEVDNSLKQSSYPIPASILVRVRERNASPGFTKPQHKQVCRA